MKRDEKFIVKVEKAIAKKYGEKTIQNPKKYWDEEKEKDYLEQLKNVQQKEDHLKQKREKIKDGEVFIDKRLINKQIDRSCPICSTYSFYSRDDLYINKFSCCRDCYLEFVEGREERWNSGWRPDKDEIENRRLRKNNKGRSEKST